MSKAIQGAVELGVAVAAFTLGGFGGVAILAAFDTSTTGLSILLGVASLGVGMEAGAIADALTSNRGEDISTRQPASPRQLVYGTQRVGGIMVFESTTGSSKSQYNMVVVLATHEIWAIQNLYLDGRQCFWAGSSDGYTIRNGYGFGGGCDGQSHLGPSGSFFTFDNGSSGHEGVFAVARWGDQASGDYVGELTANDSRWGPDANGNVPSLMGCAYFYLKCEADSNVFPAFPEIKATVKGKPIYDPRSGETAYSENWALIIADIITDPVYGLGDVVNQEQLIAAANICDEEVAYAGGGGGNEARYTCHYHYDTSTAPGDVLSTLMAGAGGRLSYIGGEYYIFPGTYTGPSTSFDTNALIDKPTWSSTRSYRELFNRVQGSYTAPNFPYNAETGPGSLSDLYDSNGYYNGSAENVFPFAFQPSSYPTYACDVLHGYAADQYLNEDGGIQLVKTLDLACVLSVTQAQRLAKMALLRNRQQGTGALVMGPEALQLQPNDTFYLTFPQRGWENKLLEVNSVQFVIDKDANGLPLVKVVVGVNETDPSVYEWSTTEELTPYDVPAAPMDLGLYTTAPPTDVQVLSSAATALVNADGTVTPRLEITWDTPMDIRVAHIQTQYRLTGAATWTDGGTVGVDSNLMFIGPIIAGQNYDVQIRSLQANGAASAWVEIANTGASIVLSVSTQDAIGPNSLVGEAFSDGTAGIECTTFTANLGGKSVTYFPTVQNITGLTQQTLYYVYVVDTNLTGGNLTPVATMNQSDYLGKLGYFLIGSIVTPYAGSGGGTTLTRYSPNTYSDTGTRTTQSPYAAYDNDLSTCAVVSSTATETQEEEGGEEQPPRVASTTGNCTWGFSAGTLAAAATLSVTAVAAVTNGSAVLTASINGTQTTLLSANGNVASNTYTLPVASGTNLSMVSVTATANATPTGTIPNSQTASLSVYEIVIQ